MLCTKCNQPTPSHAPKCGNCGQVQENRAVSVKSIKTDMFGNAVSTVKPNRAKLKEREKYLTTLPEMDAIKAERARQAKDLKTMLLQLAGIAGGLFLGIAAIVAIAVSPKVALLPLMMFGIAMMGIADAGMKLRDQLPEIRFTGDMSIHNAMPRYYGSSRVFGHVKQNKRCYNNYEIDVNEVESVTYDDHFHEYLVHMKNPVMMDCAVPADKTYRVADVFDKDTIKQAIPQII